MRNTIIYSVILILLFSSCDDLLDNSIDINLKPEQVFVNYERIQETAVAAYTSLQYVGGYYHWAQSLKACATDEAEETDYGSPAQQFNLGIWNQYSNPDDVYAKMYMAIRQCNIFLENTVDYKSILVVDTITSTGKELYEKHCQDIGWYRHELRFLRAFYYFELIKRYGGVPLITRTITEDEALEIPRSDFGACVDYIVEECDSIKDYMQLDWVADGKSEFQGRATKGAALALKSRVLLYAASPLNNPENDIQPWKDAAKAAKELIDLKRVGSSSASLYKLSNTYDYLFVAPNSYSDQEVIFYLRYANSNILEAWNYPIGTPGGRSGVSPSQNLVDAYEKLSGWDPAKPYDRIDPRMQKTIVVNNSTWNNRTIESYVGGKDGIDKRNASRTGYYLKKFLSPNLDLVSSTPGRSMKSWIFFRYGEVLLNYAEALNEAYGPSGGAEDGHTMTALEAVNLVRRRTGINLTRLLNIDQTTLREKIKNERRVELAFEEHRAWDLRRWKDGEKLSEPIRGARITKDETGVFTYDFNHIVENRVFEDKMYLYPLPQNEINKYPQVLKQNLLW
jgi:hypothetical protein